MVLSGMGTHGTRYFVWPQVFPRLTKTLLYVSPFLLHIPTLLCDSVGSALVSQCRSFPSTTFTNLYIRTSNQAVPPEPKLYKSTPTTQNGIFLSIDKDRVDVTSDTRQSTRRNCNHLTSPVFLSFSSPFFIFLLLSTSSRGKCIITLVIRLTIYFLFLLSYQTGPDL